MATATDDTSFLKKPPQAIEAERSVLGALMINQDAWDAVHAKLQDSDFYRSEHRIIYRCIASQMEQGNPVDATTISESLENIGELENIGGMPFVVGLTIDTPAASNIQAYADIVHDRATLRNLIRIANEIADSGFNPQGKDSATLIDEAEGKVFAMGSERQGLAGPQWMGDIVPPTMDRIHKLEDSGGGLTGITTGFKDIDKQTSGLQDSNLIIVAGRPSMGKTAFMMNMAEAALMEEGKDRRLLIFSLEMPAQDLVMRMLSSLGHIDQTKIRTGDLGPDDWDRIMPNANRLSNMKLYIDDSAGLTSMDIRSRARRLVRESKGNLDMIMVDYLQLMQGSSNHENRAVEISEISRSLKAIAKEFQCPVVAGSQLNRGLEQRGDKRPVMSDLRESGAIEQDADVIIAIHREHVYDNTAERNLAELIILKQRNGPIGTQKLTFFPEYTKFEDHASDAYDVP